MTVKYFKDFFNSENISDDDEVVMTFTNNFKTNILSIELKVIREKLEAIVVTALFDNEKLVEALLKGKIKE